MRRLKEILTKDKTILNITIFSIIVRSRAKCLFVAMELDIRTRPPSKLCGDFILRSGWRYKNERNHLFDGPLSPTLLLLPVFLIKDLAKNIFTVNGRALC